MKATPSKTTPRSKPAAAESASEAAAPTYTVFVRDWWREAGPHEPGWPKGLVPYAGAPRETIAEGVTYAEARELCEEYNSTHDAGRYARKAEFTAE